MNRRSKGSADLLIAPDLVALAFILAARVRLSASRSPILFQIFVMGSYGHHVTGWGIIIANISRSLGFLCLGLPPFLLRLGFLNIFGFEAGRIRLRISVLIGRLLRFPFRLISIRSVTEGEVIIIRIEILLFFFIFLGLALGSSNFPCVCSWPGHIFLIQLGSQLEMATLSFETCSRLFWISWAWRIICRRPWGEYVRQAVRKRLLEESTKDLESAERETRKHTQSCAFTDLCSMLLWW